jgi:hypothetical protein
MPVISSTPGFVLDFIQPAEPQTEFGSGSAHHWPAQDAAKFGKKQNDTSEYLR